MNHYRGHSFGLGFQKAPYHLEKQPLRKMKKTELSAILSHNNGSYDCFLFRIQAWYQLSGWFSSSYSVVLNNTKPIPLHNYS